MFDNMKMSAEQFILGLKHGVYVFVSDSCEFCTEYAKSLELVENCHLHIVECATEADKSAIYQMTGRTVLPLTTAWYDNEIQWVAPGQLYYEEEHSDPPAPEDWTINKVVKYLKETFGDKPLTPEEVVERVNMIRKYCAPAYYVFPPNTPDDVKKKAFAKAFEHNEMPVDVDTIIAIDGLSDKDKYIMLRHNYAYFKLVIFDIAKTSVYSDIANQLIADYFDHKRKTASFEMRDL